MQFLALSPDTRHCKRAGNSPRDCPCHPTRELGLSFGLLAGLLAIVGIVCVLGEGGGRLMDIRALFLFLILKKKNLNMQYKGLAVSFKRISFPFFPIQVQS